jgi:hypothetical protein
MKKLALSALAALFAATIALAQTVSAPPVQTLSLSAANNVASIGSPTIQPDAATVAIDVQGTWTGTLTLQGQVATGQWQALYATALGGVTPASTITADGVYQATISGLRGVRLIDLASGSGTAVVSFAVSKAGVAGLPGSDASTMTALGAGNGATTPTALAARFGEQINVKADFGAAGDAKSYQASIMTSGSNVLQNNSATFLPTDCAGPLNNCTGAHAKSIVVDYAGGAGAPLMTTIAGYIDAHHVSLAANAAAATPYYFASGAQIVAAGTGCAPGDTLPFAGGTASVTAVAKITHCLVAAVAQNANGSGGRADNGNMSGTCTVKGTTGAGGPPFTVAVTLTSGAISAIGSISWAGNYSTNPTSLAAEPVTGCNALSGATLTLTMGVRNLIVSTGGNYSVEPASSVSQGTPSGSESGVTFNPVWITAGTTTYGTDDTSAFQAAVNASISEWTAGADNCVYIPPGHYFLSGPMPIFWASATGGVSGCLRGEDRRRSFLYVSPAMSGDLFSWSRNYNFTSDPVNGPTESFTLNHQAASVAHLMIVGDRTTANQQNALMFYDEDQMVTADDIEIDYLNGRGIAAGITKNSTAAYIAESWFSRIRMMNVGNATSPALDWNGAGEVRCNTIDIYAPYGVGAWVHNAGGVNCDEFRVEGLQWDAASVGLDLLEIGDPAGTTALNNVHFKNVNLVDPYINAAALHITAASAANESYGVTFEGAIGGGAPLGRGIQVDYGRNIDIVVSNPINTWDYNLQMASSANVANVSVHGPNGEEAAWTANLSTAQIPGGYVMRKGLYGGAVIANIHDGTPLGGNAPGTGAVDLATTRNANTEVASGQYSAVLGGTINTANAYASLVGGGESNQAAATDATVAGGNNNVASGGQSVIAGGYENAASGTNGWIPGGKGSNDRSRYGTGCAASGPISAFNGDAQHCFAVLRGTGATGSAFRLTADMGAAGSANVVNIPNATAYLVTVDIVALDRSNNANSESWSTWTGKLTRGANAASTALTMASTPTPLTSGTVTGSAIAASADTTNGGLNLSFTPPTSNTDTWDVVARVTTVEVQ